MNWLAKGWKYLFGTEEKVYTGNVLTWDMAKIMVSLSDEYPTMVEPFTVDAKQYTIIFPEEGELAEKKFDAYVEAGVKKVPAFLGTKVIEETARFFCIPSRDYELMSEDGERIPVRQHQWSGR